MGDDSVESSPNLRVQKMKDYALTIEYKHLMHHAPGGVFVIPSADDIRVWHGVIFVRRGVYRNGIFRFTMRLPREYNDRDTWPVIHFTSSVFNPLVDPASGQLDLRVAYPLWNPKNHYVVTALTFIKKIFYIKSFAEYTDHVPNPNAQVKTYTSPPLSFRP